MAESFGARLRYERERRQIALRSIAEQTKIGVPLLEALERDDASRWPSGIFRRSFIRAYAHAIGIDPEPIVREFMERHPDPLESEPVTAQAAPARVATSIATASASPGSGPFSVKLTISWSGTMPVALGKVADWKIVRMLLG
jgi:cytoskeleton protein RodZ